MAEEVNPKAFPLAGPDLDQKLLILVQQAQYCEEIKKGVKEATKALNRGIADLIVMAADTQPFELLLDLPQLCEDKNVPYCFVQSIHKLGKSCGVYRPVVACAITPTEGSELKPEIELVHQEIKKLLV